MISAQVAISKVRRDMTLSAILRWALISVALLAILAGVFVEDPQTFTMTILVSVGAIWVILGFRSMRGTRMAAGSGSLIAAGQYEMAERQISEAVQSFSIFRMAKLMCLHDLAMLRHAQSRWQESALICRAVLNEQGQSAGGLDRSSRLILAESLLELGDLPGVHDSLSRLYQQRLTLREALVLLGVQLDYLSRVNGWEAMMESVGKRLEMAELLPPRQSARIQALMALAADKTGRIELREWLKRRVELLVDVERLCTDRPIVRELWM